MQRSIGVKIVATSYSQNTPNQQYRISPSSWVQAAMQKVSGTFGRSKQSPPLLPKHQSPAVALNTIPTRSTPGPQKSLYFIACMDGGRFHRTVHQDIIGNIVTDRELFLFMRQIVTKRRSRFRRALSLKRIEGLHFVKACYHPSISKPTYSLTNRAVQPMGFRRR
jgi:hypothetical protein